MLGVDLDALRIVLSPGRLAPYEASCGGDLSAALRLYAWNIQASNAFHGLVGCLEVAMRRAMHIQLTVHSGREDWWREPTTRLRDVDLEKICNAEREMRRRGKAPTPHDIVEDLSLGFWVSLLGSGDQYENRLWRPALYLAFPGYRGTRRPLHRELDHVRTFRNRIAHHKPIYGRHLAADHETILRLAGYVSPVLPEWMRQHDRVPEVLACRARICTGLLPASF